MEVTARPGVWVLALGLACGGDSSAGDGSETGSQTGPTATSVSTSDTTTGTTGPGTSSSSGSESSSGSASTTVSTETGSGTDDPTEGGPGELCGAVIFSETFEDTDFSNRGWYDGPSGTLSTDEHIPGSTASLECRFMQGATSCDGGTPGRHPVTEVEAVCLSYWVKYSSNYVGSGQPYHPHEFHFLTSEDPQFIGPAFTHLTTYIEQVGGVPRLAIQDSMNVDLNCVLLNNDSFVGCNGDFDTYPFTEDRSAAACNGLLGDLDGRDCFSFGNGYYSARFWDAPTQVFSDAEPYDKNDWHLVETYWRLNSIENGVGEPDGVLRYWFDGEPIIAYDQILMRTGIHTDMRFNQFLVAPYIGDGSPVDQTMWIDDLTVSDGL